MNSRIIGRLFVLLLFCGIFGSGCGFTKVRRVLVVHSYDEGYANYKEFDKLVAREFSRKGIHADIRTVYLDCESYLEQAELAHMRGLIDSVSNDWTPEVIVVNEDQATYSLLKCYHPLVKRVPVVFAGVNYPNWPLLKEYPNVTGFHDRIAFAANIDAAKELVSPKVWLFTILDFTYLDRQIRSDAQEQLKSYEKLYGFMTDTTASMTWKAKTLRNQGYTLFMAVGIRLDAIDFIQRGGSKLVGTVNQPTPNRCYMQLKRDHTTFNIGNICACPSITAINEAFGADEKILGGYFTTLPIQVEEEVGTAVRILKGEKPSNIPIAESRKEHVVDWRVIKQMHIPLSRIPAKYNIINIPLREKNPVLFYSLIGIGGLSIVTLIVSLLLLYLREQKRKKKAQLALDDEKQTLALAIEGSNTYAWKFENDLFVFEKTFWQAQNISPRSLSFEELLGLIHPDDRKTAVKNWNTTQVRKNITQMRCHFDEQEYQWWEFRYTTVLQEDETPKTAGLVLNIQEVKDRERELEEARHLAEKAELKQSFLDSMSHEIRTPLNAIVGFSNVLVSEENLDPDEKQLYIDTINRNNELLLKLIGDILDLSRIESGSMLFDFKACRVSVLVDHIYQTHRILIPDRLEFLKEEDPAQLEIQVDAGRLTQVITNFLNNAAKFTESGYIKVGYNYLPDKEQVCIYVEDTGKGIPQEVQKMIFRRFYKQDEFSQGTGLGLSICQLIVEKLGGEIALWSEPGKGSRFMVILPCRVVGESS